MNAKPHILIVDDNVEYLSTFKAFFEQHGVMVTACQSQSHALSYVERVLPHVIFVSTKIRGGSYVQVVRDVKQRDNFKTIPVLSYGEFKQDIDIKMAYEAGVQDYFDASTSLTHLICKLKVWLNQAGFVFSEDVKELTFGQYTLEVDRCLFRRNDQYIPVTTSEFVILKRLLSCKGKVLTRNNCWLMLVMI